MSLIIGLLFYLLPHAIYISVVNIQVDEPNKEYNIEIKVFSDDMLSALKSEDENIKSNPELLLTYKPQIQAYFEQHLNVFANEKQQAIKLKSITKENDTHWIQFTSSYADKLTSIALDTDMLIELFPLQSNIVSIAIGQEKEYYRLSKKRTGCKYILPTK